jgi:hypothetical protein
MCVMPFFVCQQIVPPLTAGHCKLCDVCFYRPDHHCLFLNRCIAADNRRLFVFFVTGILGSMVVFEYLCLEYLRKQFTKYSPSADYWPAVVVIFSSHSAVWSMFVLNGLSLVFVGGIFFFQLDDISKGQGHVTGRGSHVGCHRKMVECDSLSVRQRIRNIIWFGFGRSL